MNLKIKTKSFGGYVYSNTKPQRIMSTLSFLGMVLWLSISLFCSTVLGQETNMKETLVNNLQKVQEFEKAKRVLANKLLKEIFNEPNEALAYYINPELKKEMAFEIAGHLQKENENAEKHIAVIKKLYQHEDFRWIAVYLKSLTLKDKTLQELFASGADMTTISLYTFLNEKQTISPEAEIIVVEKIEDVFNKNSGNKVYVSDENGKKIFNELQSTTNNRIFNYVENSFDLAGRYSLVRKGLVKKLPFKNGIIAKKNNPAKEGRFLNEQKNVVKLRKILKLPTQNDFLTLKDSNNQEFHLKLLSPFAVASDSKSGAFYSLTFLEPGKTLEEILVSAKDSSARRQYLEQARVILDLLFEKGVVWGDMAPRNILVSEKSGVRTYTILDFEKTLIIDKPISVSERIEHGRGPIYVEEFGAICPENELVEVFSPYFKPDEWNVASIDPVSFKKPKREVVSILESRQITPITLGKYNQLEKEIMEVRFPQVQQHGLRYPLSISFRVDHYLGNVYDLKTTELLMAVKKNNLLFPVMDILEKRLEALENRLIINDFKNIVLDKSVTSNEHKSLEMDLLAKSIDSLYEDRNSLQETKKLLDKMYKQEKVYQISRDPEYGVNGNLISRRISEVYSESIKNILKEADLGSTLTVAVAGGFSRNQMLYGSDIDIALITQDPSVKLKISQALKKIGLEAEFYQTENFSALQEHPDLFLDAHDLKYVSGDSNKISNIRRKFEEFKQNTPYVKSVLQTHWLALQNAIDQDNKIEIVKNLKNMVEILHLLKPFDNETYSSINSYLLYVKSNLRIGKSLEDQSQEHILNDIINYTGAIYRDKLLTLYKPFLDQVHSELESVNEECIQSKLDPKKTNIVCQDRKKFLTPTIVPKPINILYGMGASLLTDRGMLIDLSSMTVNCILGQNDPWVTKHQMSYLSSGRPSFHSSRLGSEIYYDYVNRLGKLKVGNIKDMLVNHKQTNGSDLVDLALKAASVRKNGRHHIASFKGSYHGQNLSAYLSSEVQHKHVFLLDNDPGNVEFIDLPKERNNPLETGNLTEDEAKIIALIQAKAKDVYAVLLEPIQGNNGLYTFSRPFLIALRKLCSANDVCLIFDEIQTGFGYLGKLTASEVYDVSPDILLLSKAVTAGYGPLAMMLFDKKYTIKDYGTTEKTQGADLRSLVAANAVLDRLIGLGEKPNCADDSLAQELKQGLLHSFTEKEDKLLSYLKDIQIKHPNIVQGIKGLGVMRGLVIKSPNNIENEKFLEGMIAKLLDKGVLVRKSKNVMIIKPPLVIKDEELKKAFSIINETFLETEKNMHS